MLKDITLGQYFPGNSPIHRLDPRTKLILLVVYIVALFLAQSWISYAVMLSFLLYTIKISKIPPKSIIRGMKPIVMILVFTGVLNLFFTREGPELLNIGNVVIITSGGLTRAVFMMARILMLITGTFLLTYTTSPISLTALAAATKRPDRVVGMHFFSPVPKMRLCEVIFGLLTAEDVLHQIKEVGEQMGKTLILSDDKPGFIVNRALLPMLNEACVIVGSNIGSVEDMDNGMKLGCNHPMGPLELADMIGLDILLNVMTVLHSEYGEKYHPSLLLRKMVRAGFLGRKSGAGFYVYENGKKAGVNPNLTRVHAL